MSNMNVFTGATREVSVDQMLFSTTDERGVIGFSNRAFVELSEYSREQLVSPHWSQLSFIAGTSLPASVPSFLRCGTR